MLKTLNQKNAILEAPHSDNLEIQMQGECEYPTRKWHNDYHTIRIAMHMMNTIPNRSDS
jgi:hypothetical protein